MTAHVHKDMRIMTGNHWLPTARLLCVVLTFTASQLATASEEKPKPNVIVFLVDDLGWMDLSCQGSEYYETQNIDRLAQQGMRFTSGYAACAVCSPSRAAVQTGRDPARLGVTDWIRMWFQSGLDEPDGPQPPEYEVTPTPTQKLRCPTNRRHLDLDETTSAEVLKAAGYVSCHIGKWHLGQEPWYPSRQGYDFNHGGCDLGQPGNYFDPYDVSGWRKFPRFKELYNARLEGIPTLPPRREGEYLTDRLADEAVGFIEDHRDEPFFLNLCTYAVHTPLQAKKKLIKHYEAKPHGPGENPVYAAMIHSVDDAVGRVLSTLEDLKLTDRTIVIFTSDNGGFLSATSNAPLRSGKGHPYEGGIRVPWIIRWPGVTKTGSTSDVPISSIDIFPTILQIAGAVTPEERVIDGQSLVPLLRQTGTLKRDALYWHYPHYWSDQTPYSIIRSGDWKLIKHYEGPTFELYKLADDLSEKNDLAPSMPDKVRQLNLKLTSHLASIGAKLPQPNPSQQSSNKPPMTATIRVDCSDKIGEISPLMYGGGFEHVAGAVNLGLDAQMLAGRSFEEDDLNEDGVSDKWLPTGGGDHAITRFQDGRDRFHARHSQVIKINAYADGESGIKQKGLFTEKGKRYTASLFLKGSVSSPVRLCLAMGEKVCAQATIPNVSLQWKKYTVTLISSLTTAEAELRILLGGNGSLQVDQVSLIPEDTHKGHGTRKDIVEKIIDIGPTIVRWPGGWFAEVYRWKQGIGDVDRRPLIRKYYANVRNRHNPSWDPNSFGTDEFIQFCRDIEATPMLTVNSGYDQHANMDELVKEAAQWVEYCNGDATTKFGALRKANGHPEPYNVRYWNVGNEVFEMDTEKYARRFVRFARAMREKDPCIKLIAEGGRTDDRTWNQTLLRIAGDDMDYLDLHHYCSDRNYLRAMAEPLKYERWLGRVKKDIATHAPGRDIKIGVLEWNANSGWQNASTLKEGLVAAGWMNALERQDDIVEMASPWPMIRKVQPYGNHVTDHGLIWHDNHRVYLSPTGLAVQLYHQNYAPDRVKSTVQCDTFDVGNSKGVPYLDVVATRDPGKRTLILKVVNKSRDRAVVANIELSRLPSGEPTADVVVSTLTAKEVTSSNRLSHPQNVHIDKSVLKTVSSKFTFTFPPHSATVLRW